MKPGASSAFHVQNLPKDGPRKLLAMGLLTSLLNPKVAVLYLSLLPQFIKPELGSVFLQSVIFGLTHIAISVTGNTLIALSAGSISTFLAGRPLWMAAQRWVMARCSPVWPCALAFEARR